MILRMVGTGSILSKRNCACTLLDGKILVDCGGGIVKALLGQGINPVDLKTILVTHLHGDHCADLPCLTLYRYLNQAQNTLTIYGPKGTEIRVSKLFRAYYEDVEIDKVWESAKIEFREFVELKGESVDGGYTIEAFPVLHGKMHPAYGYMIGDNAKKIMCSGDAALCDEVIENLRAADLAVMDMCLIKGNNCHMGLDNIGELLKTQQKPIIATHMSDEARRSAMKLALGKLFIPDDGATLSI